MSVASGPIGQHQSGLRNKKGRPSEAALLRVLASHECGADQYTTAIASSTASIT
jgi:hypothetical protein